MKDLVKFKSREEMAKTLGAQGVSMATATESASARDDRIEAMQEIADRLATVSGQIEREEAFRIVQTELGKISGARGRRLPDRVILNLLTDHVFDA